MKILIILLFVAASIGRSPRLWVFIFCCLVAARFLYLAFFVIVAAAIYFAGKYGDDSSKEKNASP